MENIIEIQATTGIEGVMERINVINFPDAIYALNKFYGISLKALAKFSGINYNTLRAIKNYGNGDFLSEEKTAESITKLKLIYAKNKH